jgi:hypothetical protein
MCEHAFDNQRAGPELPTWRHLKDWLLIHPDVGHCQERRVKVGKLTPREAQAAGVALATALRTGEDFVGVGYDTKHGEFVVRTAKSVSFRAVTSDDMAAITDKVVGLICKEILPGTDPEDLFNATRSESKVA